MTHLTQKELFAIEDALSAEALLCKKFTGYAAMAKDPQIRNTAQQTAHRHKQHYESLLAYLY